MKKNKNNMISSDYYIGIDAGTNSVGFAVTDMDYNLCKFKGKSMWGVRLFDEAQSGESRRINRTNRRRLNRRKQRLEILYLLFKNEIDKVDPNFDKRMKESSLVCNDKTMGTKYSLFSDLNYNDKDYLKEYPTIYHLRKRLIESKEPVDIRLVYLAIHHILKSRGHFLFDVSNDLEDSLSFSDAIYNYLYAIEETLGLSLSVSDNERLHEILIDKKIQKTEKKKLIVALIECSYLDEEKSDKEVKKQIEEIAKLIIGLKASMSNLFANNEYKSSFSVTSDFEENDDIKALGDDNVAVIFEAKKIYDMIKLEEILGSCTYISEYMVGKYDEHHNDIQELKLFLKKINNKELYKKIFKEQSPKLANYSAFSGYKKSDKEYSCNTEEFCSFLKKELEIYREDIPKLYFKITEGNFAQKLRNSDNGVIPNSLHKKELQIILNNASNYLEFLNQIDTDGMSIKDKIFSLFEFRIPYYVGPLNNISGKHWIVKKFGMENEKIYPWNFDKIVNKEKTAEQFIVRMTGKCSYTGEDALPMDSLIYREYTVLNEINAIKVNGKSITKKCKDLIYSELFVKNSKKVTKKAIHECLLKNGEIQKSDEISGVDTTLSTSLSSYHKLKNIINKVQDIDLIEDLIRRINIFGQDKKLLKSWIVENIKNITEDDIKYLTKINFSGWGSFSKTFLTRIFGTKSTQTGEAVSVIEAMREESKTFMEVFYEYNFEQASKDYLNDKDSADKSLDKKLDEMYLSPVTRRSIRQTLRIIDEIVDIKKSAPKKIFIEMARGEDKEKKRTVSRKEKLIALYEACKKNSGELYNELVGTSEGSLRQDKLFLFFSQFGRCMYSGEEIPFAELQDNGKWDIDHIFPRSKIKDDSLNNRVLVKAQYNRSKTNEYPIKAEWRNKMYGTWKNLLEKGMIEKTKFERLVRSYPLTESELHSFVSRQLVVTQQSTKALAELLGDIYKDAGTKIVYSKARNVSDFRKFYGYRSEKPYTEFVKCRDINDHHHAKDAYLNVVVGNFYDTKFTEKFFKNIMNENYTLNPKAMFSYPVKGAWEPESEDGKEGTIATVRKMMKRNDVLYTRMPREEHGQLYKVTILKKGQGQVPIKNCKSIGDYGGYDKASGAYFAVVEHGTEKKRIRTIEAILIYEKVEYEKDNVKFFENKGLVNPKIIVDKVLYDSVIEIDGVRYHIKGRSDDKIIYNHLCQLVIGETMTIKIRKVLKYLENVNPNKIREPYENENITESDNLCIYDCLYNKVISAKPYIYSFSKIGDYLQKYRENFINLDVYNQCVFVREILKALKCNNEMPSFSKGRIRKSKNISKSCTAYIINQSVTGLYEVKVDLLK